MMTRLSWPIFVLPGAAGALYFLVLTVLGDLTTLNLLFGGLMLGLFYGGATTRRFLSCAWPMLSVPLVYDLLRYGYQDFITGSVHVAEPYSFEKTWFGINTVQGRLTLNEFFATLHSIPVDLICGFVYLVFVFEVMGIFLYLYKQGHVKAVWIMSVSFLLVNLLGYATYFVYPAAPPWYVAQYGLGPALMSVHANPAGALRFDAWVGIPLFQNFYGQANDVFGAIPSLHVSYPLLAVFACFMAKKLRIFSVSFLALMCFSAVYLQHHYVLDVLVGAIYAGAMFIPVYLFYRNREMITPVLEHSRSPG